MPLRRLDERARDVVALANDIAHEFEVEYVGTEHILLAILRQNENVGARALHALGVSEDQVRKATEDLMQRAKEDTWVFGRLPGSPHYRNVIERAMKIAEQLESPTIAPEHLLLALYQEKDSAAQHTLTELGISHKRCRDEILRQLSSE